MRNLGLGIKMDRKKLAAAGIDWANYDGSKNGSLVNMVTGGGVQVHGSAVGPSGTNGVLVYYDSTQLKAVGFTISGTTPTEGSTPVNVTNAVVTNIPEFPFVEALTDTKFLAFSVIEGTLDYHVALLTWSAGEVTVTDEYTLTGFTDANMVEKTIFRLNDTQAVIVCSEDSGTDEVYCQVIDAAADTLSEGTPLLAYPLATQGAPADTPAGCRISDTAFMVATQKRVCYCTVSGTTITLQDDVGYDGSFSSMGTARQGVRIDATRALFLYGTVETAYQANVFTWNGSDTVNRGTEAVGILTNVGSISFDEKCAVYLRLNDGVHEIGVIFGDTSDGGKGYVAVLGVNDSTGEITTVLAQTKFTDYVLDHPSCDAVGTTGDYIHVAFQNEGDSPVKQVGNIILAA